MSNTRHARTRPPLDPIELPNGNRWWPAQGEREPRQLPGQQEAVTMAAALGLAMDRAQLQPGCARCVRREKSANAADPQIRQAVTWQDGEPVCWDDFEVTPQ